MKQFADLQVKEQWKLFLSDLRRPCETPRVPFMAEDLPSDFVPRPEQSEPLIEMLLDKSRERQRHPVAIATALQGGGGFGKTMLATAICHDDRVHEVFDDGILWVTLGENVGEERLKGKITDLVRVLSGQPTEFDTKEAAGTRLRELLAESDILMVIDDIWNPDDLHPFLQGGPLCARLITTRNLDTLPTECQDIKVDSMAPTEASALLGNGLPSECRKEIGELANRLGKWPLLLGIVNGVLRQQVQRMHQSLGDALVYVTKALDKRGLTAFDPNNSVERERAVESTIAVSLDLFTETERKRFRELTIFREDVNVPLQIVAALWRATGGLDEFDTDDLCVRLHRHSLLQTLDLATREVRLHNVMRTYLLTALAKRVSPSQVHSKLVGAWGDPCLLSDDYSWRWYTHHLAGAGREPELRALLLNPEWLQRKLEATDCSSLISDFDSLPEDEALRLVQAALRLSSHVLAQAPQQLVPQHSARLWSSRRNAVETRVRISKFQRDLQRRAVEPWLRLLHPTLAAAGGALIRILTGHSDWVTGVAVTPDGQRAVSASWDKTLKVWDLGSGRELRTLSGHADSVTAVAVTPDGQCAVSASADKTLKVWELASGRELRTLTGHADQVTAVAVTPDGQYAVAAYWNHTLKVWELGSGRELCTLTGHTYGVTAVAVTPDGQRAVSASADHTLKMWELGRGRELRTLAGHSDSVTAVAVTPDGQRAVSASADKTLKVWELGSGCELRTLTGHSRSVTAVAVTAGGRQAVSASWDQTLKVWDVESGRELRALTGHSGHVEGVAVTPDGRRAVSASEDQTLKVWDIGNGRSLLALTGHAREVTAVTVTPDGKRAISASADQTLKVWDVGSGRELRTLTGHSRSVTAVAVTPDGRRAVSASYDETLKVWDVTKGRELYTVTGQPGYVEAVAVTPDGKRAVSASWDQTLKVWELESGRALRTLTGHRREVTAVAVTPDGKRAVSASADQTQKVWALGSGRALRTLTGHEREVTSVAVTPDGKRAISASADQTLKVWELGSGRVLRTLTGHRREVTAVAVTPDGKRTVSASADQTLRVWDLRTGKLVAMFACDAAIYGCAFADCRTIVAGDGGGQVHVLKLENAGASNATVL